MQSKTCTRCQINKPLDDFHKHTGGRLGVRAKCKKCIVKYNKKWQPEPSKIKKRRKTPLEYRAMQLGCESHGYQPTLVELQLWYGETCLWPGCETKSREIDHIIPLIAGGVNHWDNMQPLCKSHNSKKHIEFWDFRKFRFYGITEPNFSKKYINQNYVARPERTPYPVKNDSSSAYLSYKKLFS